MSEASPTAIRVCPKSENSRDGVSGIGAWLLNLRELIQDEIADIDQFIENQGVGRALETPVVSVNPLDDKKLAETIALITACFSTIASAAMTNG